MTRRQAAALLADMLGIEVPRAAELIEMAEAQCQSRKSWRTDR